MQTRVGHATCATIEALEGRRLLSAQLPDDGQATPNALIGIDATNIALVALSSVEVTFDDSQTILEDDGTAYTTPHWVDSNADGDADDAGEQANPIAYVRSRPADDTTMTVTAEFTFNGNLTAGTYDISGVETGGTGLSFDESVTLAAAGNTLIATMDSCGALGNTIDLRDFVVDWTITQTAGGAFNETYNSSDNTLYVTGGDVDNQYETVLDIGCSNATGLRPADPGEGEPDATDNNRAVTDAVWGEFSDNVVDRLSDGLTMQYNHDFDTGLTAADMLAHPQGKGQCTAWADLLVLSLGAQGVAASSVRVDPPATQSRFRVRLMPAQGSGGANYTTTDFVFHQVVKVDCYPKRIYDPSYGGMTEDAVDVELKYEDDNIVGFLNAGGAFTADTKGVKELVW
jgi:hypothetical protein